MFPGFLLYMMGPGGGHTRREVMKMKYPDLNALLREEPEARQYYNQLPDYVRDQIAQRPGGVNSLASLQDYAENLTRGDG